MCYKKFINFWILSLIFLNPLSAQEIREKFLSTDAYKIISLSKDVYITKIREMALTPQFVPAGTIHPSSKKLSQLESDLVSKDLSLSYKINPDERLKECKLEPGLMLTYANGKNELGTVLICFNCDLWAVSKVNPRPYQEYLKTEISAFGDLRPYRADLLAIARKLYPDDESFKILK